MTGLETAGAAVGLALGAVALLGAGLKTFKVVRRVSHFFDDWFGEEARQGQDARPGMMARVKAIEDQLNPNHGTSMHDKVTRIDDALAQHLEDAGIHVDPTVHLFERGAR